LRCRIERESGGRQTVLYTAKGQPSYMNLIPIMACETLGPGLGRGPHAAFIVNGRVCQEFFYGTYGGAVKHGELVSQPGVAPATHMDFAAASRAARACGPGWHLGTNAERATLMLWCRRQGLAQQGNTDSGRSIHASGGHGIRVDGGSPGDPAGNPATLTGSGPNAWRHDHSSSGIADLCGNVWEWQAGLRLMDGEIQVIGDNDAAHADLSAASAAWVALSLSDGTALAPGHPDSAKFDAGRHCTDGNAGAPVLRSRLRHRNGPAGDHANHPGLIDAPFGGIGTDPGVGVPPILRALGLMPCGPASGGAQVYLRNYGERIFMAGGAWYSGHDAGLEALCLSHPRTHSSGTVGARPAFIAT
jgi:formylglycine-generating enzyme required for sulfatase activity